MLSLKSWRIINLLPQKMWLFSYTSDFQTQISGISCKIATTPHRWLVNIGSSEKLVLLCNNDLPDPMRTWIFVTIYYI